MMDGYNSRFEREKMVATRNQEKRRKKGHQILKLLSAQHKIGKTLLIS